MLVEYLLIVIHIYDLKTTPVHERRREEKRWTWHFESTRRHSVQRGKKPKAQAVSKKRKNQNKLYRTENEYKKINKSNIMCKINYSYSLFHFFEPIKPKEINSYNSETQSTNLMFTLLSKNRAACTDALIETLSKASPHTASRFFLEPEEPVFSVSPPMLFPAPQPGVISAANRGRRM